MSAVDGRWIIKAFAASIMFSCVALLFFIIGPDAETKFWPVYSKMVITNVKQATGGGAYITVVFTKHRECDYMGLSWFKVIPNGVLERVFMSPMRKEGDFSSPNLPVGTFVEGPWLVGIESEEIEEYSMVEAYHRCHPFWTTRTHFYP